MNSLTMQCSTMNTIVAKYLETQCALFPLPAEEIDDGSRKTNGFCNAIRFYIVAHIKKLLIALLVGVFIVVAYVSYTFKWVDQPTMLQEYLSAFCGEHSRLFPN